MTQPWSEEHKRRILTEYQQTRRVTCPLDQMPLDVMDEAEGDVSSAIVFTCSTCGNAFSSSELRYGGGEHDMYGEA
ncbi:MAG: hypothetical protein M3R24_28330 [Chloroflexota bacterium]|nr:hypothetical protein [Chloroflexota bacterium]